MVAFRIIAIERGGHQFRIIYDDSSEAAAIETILKLQHDPDVPLSREAAHRIIDLILKDPLTRPLESDRRI